MPLRYVPQNETDYVSCSEGSQTIREHPEAPPRLRQLRLVCVESGDRHWMLAYEKCSTLHGQFLKASLTREARVDEMMRAARRLFRGVFDADGHSAPAALAACMNGLTPTDLEVARIGSRLRALKKLLKALPGRLDVEFDANAKVALETALNAAVIAVREEERARGAWRGAVVAKREAAEEFNRGYRALVSAARELGGAAWINPWFPSFTDSNGKSAADDVLAEDEDMAEPAIDDIDDIDGVEDTPSPEEVSATANAAV